LTADHTFTLLLVCPKLTALCSAAAANHGRAVAAPLGTVWLLTPAARCQGNDAPDAATAADSGVRFELCSFLSSTASCCFSLRMAASNWPPRLLDLLVLPVMLLVKLMAVPGLSGLLGLTD
jgi:hypothetical protein